MKLAFVTPRYGPTVIGGAEGAARSLAERLVDRFGWQVSAYSTCARSAVSWEDVDPPGTEVVNGVTLHRFRSLQGRSEHYHAMAGRLFQDPKSAPMAEAQRWVGMQGPLCPDLVEAATASDADFIVYYPYLFYPTIRGVPLSPGRAILHPAAHDEAALRLPVFRDVFEGAAGIAYHTAAERRLVLRSFAVGATPSLLLGLGVEASEGAVEAAEPPEDLGGRPYFLCLGRVEEGKGSLALARSFAFYKSRRPGPEALVFAGPEVNPLPDHPDIIVAGPVDEARKWSLLKGALALVSPSAMESFSLVVMEAWTAGIPVAVTAYCEPTREHCEQSGGGLWFDGYRELEVVLDRLSQDAALRSRLGAAGQAYVRRRFAWPAILDRYRSFLEALASRRRALRPTQTA